jgi:hypothetical protein
MDAALAGLIGAGIGVVGGLVPTMLTYTLERKRYHDEKDKAAREAAEAAVWQRASAYRHFIGAASNVDLSVNTEDRARLVADLQQATAEVVVFGSATARDLLRGHGWLATWSSSFSDDEVRMLKESVLAPFMHVVDQEYGSDHPG